MEISALGHRITVEREGTGRPLVLLHGLGTPSVWNRVRCALSKSFELFIVHLPGFGSSEPARERLSVHNHVLLVESLLESLHLDGVSLCGVSYGGQVAATLAARFPARCSALILINASGLMTRYRVIAALIPFRAAGEIALRIFLRDEASLRRWNGRLYYDGARQPEEVVHEFYRMISLRERRLNWLDCLRNAAVPERTLPLNLSRIAAPTLVLWANEDRVVPVRFSHEFVRRIPSAELKIVRQCGHALPLEQPEELCAAIVSFAERRMPGHRPLLDNEEE